MNNLNKTKAFSVLLTTLFFMVSTHGKETIENKITPSKVMTYKVIDGISLKLQVFNPEGMQPDTAYPVIIFFFGGGWNGGSTKQFEYQAQHFATKGMISVLADYRVKNRHKTTPFDAVRDANSAIRYLRTHAKKLHINPNKIVASGGSAGGHLAAAATLIKGLEEPNEDLTISSEANALVLFNPVIDNSQNGYGYERIGERYSEISPLHNIEKGAPPAIFFLGTNDKLIPVSTAKAFQTKMQAVGSRCDLHLYEGQPHGFFNKRNNGMYQKKTAVQATLFLQSLGYIKKEAE